MKIALRLDDICPDMDWGKFFRFTDLLDRYGIRPLLGVIPENKDPMLRDFFKDACLTEEEEKRIPEDFWAYLRELRDAGYVMAMHGYDHLYRTKRGGMFPLNGFSEYAGLPYEEQLQKLTAGYGVLKRHGIETDLFMAPAHSYDRNTLKALKALSFHKITDGFGNCPYRYSGMEFYPISFRRSDSLKQKDGYTTFVVHTNTMKDEDLVWYEGLLEKASSGDPGVPYRFISYGEYLNAEKKEGSAPGRMAEYLKALTKSVLVKLKGDLS